MMSSEKNCVHSGVLSLSRMITEKKSFKKINLLTLTQHNSQLEIQYTNKLKQTSVLS